MALPVLVLYLPVIQDMAVLYHGSNFVGCFRGSFRNWRALHVLFPELLVYWPTFPRLSLALIPPARFWQDLDSYVWAHFSSPCASSLLIWDRFRISSVLLTLYEWTNTIFLVLNYFHWFNIVAKLAFPEVPILFLHDETLFIVIETFFELFSNNLDRFVLFLPPWYRLSVCLACYPWCPDLS